eukprot:9477919-Pyramimonas_sp.AAC.1
MAWVDVGSCSKWGFRSTLPSVGSWVVPPCCRLVAALCVGSVRRVFGVCRVGAASLPPRALGGRVAAGSPHSLHHIAWAYITLKL